MPKNSDFRRSPKVGEVEGWVELIVTTTSAEPVGTSAGSLILNSRLAGISAVSVTVLDMAPFPKVTISASGLEFNVRGNQS